MVRGELQSLDRLLEGPTFADELSGSAIDEELMKILGINHFRIVPPRSAMGGVYGIYFFGYDTAEAIIRYSQRYRWVMEVVIRSGMSGERRLRSRGFPDAAIEFLGSIVPDAPKNVNPVVYQILWKAADKEEYLNIAIELQDERKFTPRKIIERNSELDEGDSGYFCQFIRQYLIESMNAVKTRRHSHGGAGGDEISVDLNNEYRVTSIGEEAIPDIVSEYERLFIDKELEPLRLGEEEQKSAQLEEKKEPYGDAQVATADNDDVISLEQSDLSEFV
jgi:hypothetical protein